MSSQVKHRPPAGDVHSAPKRGACCTQHAAGGQSSPVFTRSIESNQQKPQNLPESQTSPTAQAHIDYHYPSSFAPNPYRQISINESIFRHTGWKADRRRVFLAMQACLVSPTKLTAFANCGTAGAIEWNKELQQHRITCVCCHNRFCVPCAKARASIIARNLADYCVGKPVRFLTLTLKCNSLTLAEQIDRLYRSFTALRRRKFWRSAVVGGAAFIEIKLGENSGKWHVHLHALVEGTFLNQQVLSHEWYAVTGDSYITHIEAINDKKTQVSYVAKYGSKAISHDVICDPNALQEAMTALTGRHVCLTFGSWRGLELEARQDQPGEWKHICTISELVQACEAREEWAVGILKSLHFNPLDVHERPPPDRTLPLFPE